MNTFDNYPKFLLALCLWREARGESNQARAAIACVIRNRAKSSRWPRSIAGVILQRKQFSSFNLDDPNAVRMPKESDASDWKAWKECCVIVDSEPGEDPTLGANHYHSVPESKPQPKWADPKKLTVKLGAFKFYKL